MDPLSELALKYGTDKGVNNTGWHCYTPHYHELFSPYREDIDRVLEIGVYNGASLRMWRDYFPDAFVIGLDYAKEVTEESLWAIDREHLRSHVHIGDQRNETDLNKLIDCAGFFDIVIDDGSHALDDYMFSFQHLWPLTQSFYIIEDIAPEFQQATLAAAHKASLWVDMIPSQAGNKDRFAVVMRK